jgi:hypothetical protein
MKRIFSAVPPASGRQQGNRGSRGIALSLLALLGPLPETRGMEYSEVFAQYLQPNWFIDFDNPEVISFAN